MTKKQSVIKYLNHCIHGQKNRDESCPECGYDRGSPECICRIMEDAVAELIETEPRMLKMEEVKEHDGAIFIDCVDGKTFWAFCDDITKDRFIFLIKGASMPFGQFPKDIFNKYYHLWTGRPTKEQIDESWRNVCEEKI